MESAERLWLLHNNFFNRFVRWSRFGAFDRIFASLLAEAGLPERLMIDSTHLTAHRTGSSILNGLLDESSSSTLGLKSDQSSCSRSGQVAQCWQQCRRRAWSNGRSRFGAVLSGKCLNRAVQAIDITVDSLSDLFR